MSESEGGLTKAQEEENARLFLKNQGLVSLCALASLGAFIYFPNAYVSIGCVLFISAFAKYLESRSDKRYLMGGRNRTVLITGCDTGIGNLLATDLLDQGVTVFAGCLDVKSHGAEDLRKLCHPRMHVVQLDVTKEAEVDAAVKFVNKATDNNGLWALVNNAGAMVVADAELTPVSHYERLVSVNQLGAVRVTKAFLPLVRTKQGRIVNITSMSGRLPGMFTSAYDMTQAAVEAFSSVLRREMRRFSVKVVVVETGDYQGATDILESKRVQRDNISMWRGTSREVQDIYGKDYMIAHVTETHKNLSSSCNQLSNVVDKLIEALFTESPKTRYTVGGSNSWYDKLKSRRWLCSFLPDWYTDGLWTHDVRTYPNPADLVGKPHSHSH